MAIFNTVYGGEPKWKPWANTLAYYPLDWSLNDESWNWLNLTSSWLSWETLSSWRKVASVTGTWYLEKTNPNFWDMAFDWTISSYINQTVSKSSWAYWTIIMKWTNATNQDIELVVNWVSLYCWVYGWGMITYWNISMNTFYHAVMTYNKSTWKMKFYVNWTYVWESSFTLSISSTSNFRMWYATHNNNPRTWQIWETIVESKEWTATEVANYFNQTKSNYWL